jgi:hypothetical protein
LLEDIPHAKLACSVIIVRDVDLEKILSFLKEYNAEVCTREITPTLDDEKNSKQRKLTILSQSPTYHWICLLSYP